MSCISRLFLAMLVCSIALTAPILSHASAGYSVCGESDVSFRGKVRAKAFLSLPDCSTQWQQQSIELRFKYSQNINSWFFKKAAKVILKRNLSKQEWSDNKATFKKIENAYEAIKENDEYVISFNVKTNTLELRKNGRLLLNLKDSNAQRYFLIWFGEKPMDKAVKSNLLKEK